MPTDDQMYQEMCKAGMKQGFELFAEWPWSVGDRCHDTMSEGIFLSIDNKVVGMSHFIRLSTQLESSQLNEYLTPHPNEGQLLERVKMLDDGRFCLEHHEGFAWYAKQYYYDDDDNEIIVAYSGYFDTPKCALLDFIMRQDEKHTWNKDKWEKIG